MLSVSIVIPTYNEKENLAELLPWVHTVLRGREHEILVVDDSSPDGTAEAVRLLSSKIPQLKLITRRKKEGIGAALRCGYDCAVKDVILSMDADLSHNPEDIARLLERIESGDDLVLSCRHTEGGGYEATTLAVRLKFLISLLGNRLVRSIVGLDIPDYSTNFRAMRRTVWRDIHTEDNTNFILLEMILKIQARGYRIGWIPIFFADRRRGESKLNLWIEAPKFLLKLGRFVLRRSIARA